MKTMNKFWKYFINFVVLMLLVSGFTYFGMDSYQKRLQPIECSIETQSPVIEITETTNRKLTGTVTNDTNILINNIYVKADFFNETGKLVGTEYYEIKYFNVGEKAKFEIEYTYRNITNIVVSTTDVKF